MDDNTCYYTADHYVSIEFLLKHYFDEYFDAVLAHPIFTERGIHVHVELEVE